MLFALSLPVAAQEPAKVRRIGVLVSSSASLNASRDDALRQGLREMGYVEGKNIIIEYRYETVSQCENHTNVILSRRRRI